MLEELRAQVCKANKDLVKYDLVKFTWGNVSAIDRETGYVVIKPSGVEFDDLTPENMVITDLMGNIIEGELNPSSDLPTHIQLYNSYDCISSVVHTHSPWATIMAQIGMDIVPCGTTHADTFYGDIPCTPPLTKDQIHGDYELETGCAIVETLFRKGINPEYTPACLVISHGPFTWGATPDEAVKNSVILELVCDLAWHTLQVQFGNGRMQQDLLDKHFFRKHGENAYYGQKKKDFDIKPIE